MAASPTGRAGEAARPLAATPARERRTGYAPLREYAIIGDGRTAALVAGDGSIDWLCLPNLDSPSIFAALLDCARGGAFRLAPTEPFSATRRYLPDTNVLETTFRTGGGLVRVTDAMTMPGGGLAPQRELVRAVEGVSGAVRLAWQVEPRFGYGSTPARFRWRAGAAVASSGADALAVLSWDAGRPRAGQGGAGASFTARAGARALISLAAAHQEPLVLPARQEVESRLAETGGAWRQWVAGRGYEGPWREAVIRSALALKLLVFAPSGAIAAAPTTSLPEEIGGERNWDYRFSWIRDSVFTLDAFLALGCFGEAQAYFWWLMHASQLTHPRLNVLYRLDGGTRTAERAVPLEGYRGSRPVRVGNDAANQVQLDTYGELLQTAWLYTDARGRLDADLAARLAGVADLVAACWRQPDAGIWEVRSAPRHFTQSKMMCAIALDRALALAERGLLPARRSAAWRAERAAVLDFIETACWSEDARSYARFAGGRELDASVLLGVLFDCAGLDRSRLAATVDAVERELADGPFVRRYGGEDGLAGSEGAFLACSFWLVEALARVGRLDDAERRMEELIGLANDVGLLSEEIDPGSGDFLGNMPQGLSHLALVRAAGAIAAGRGV